MLPMLTLVLGGAASGKSAFAEGLARGGTGRRVYIATAQAFDAEMRAKIAAHRARRVGDDWRCVEAPQALTDAVSGLRDDEIGLIDCLTMWLSNRMLDDADTAAEIETLVATIDNAACPLVVVSNETGQGIVPETALGRRFREAQGRANQRIAARADLVVAVMAGLPLVLKGTLPPWA